MSDYVFPQGSTSVTVYVKLSNVSTGLGLTGLAYNSGGLQASYVNSRTGPTPIVLSPLAAATSAYSAGAFLEVSATSAPGLYRIDPPDSLFTAGNNYGILNVSQSSANPVSLFITLDPNPDELTGTIQSSATNSTTQFLTNLASTTTNFYNDSFLLFRTGNLANQQKKITAYAGSTPAKLITTAAYTSAPTTGDIFVVVNR